MSLPYPMGRGTLFSEEAPKTALLCSPIFYTLPNLKPLISLPISHLRISNLKHLPTRPPADIRMRMHNDALSVEYVTTTTT